MEKHPGACTPIDHLLAGSTVRIVNLQDHLRNVADIHCPKCGSATTASGFCHSRGKQPSCAFNVASQGLFDIGTAMSRKCTACFSDANKIKQTWFDDNSSEVLSQQPASVQQAVGYHPLAPETDANGMSLEALKDMLFHARTGGSMGTLHTKFEEATAEKCDGVYLNICSIALLEARRREEFRIKDLPVMEVPYINSLPWALIKQAITNAVVPSADALMKAYATIVDMRKALYDEYQRLQVLPKQAQDKLDALISLDHNWAMAAGCGSTTLVVLIDNITGEPVFWKLCDGTKLDDYEEELRAIGKNRNVLIVYIDDVPGSDCSDDESPKVKRLKELTGAKFVCQDIMHVLKRAMESADVSNNHTGKLREALSNIFLKPDAAVLGQVARRVLLGDLADGSFVRDANMKILRLSAMQLNAETRSRIVDLLFDAENAEGDGTNLVKGYIHHGARLSTAEAPVDEHAVDVDKLLEVLKPNKAFLDKFDKNIPSYTPAPEEWPRMQKEIQTLFEKYTPAPSRLSNGFTDNLSDIKGILRDSSKNPATKLSEIKAEVDRLEADAHHDARLLRPDKNDEKKVFASNSDAQNALNSLLSRGHATLDPSHLRDIIVCANGPLVYRDRCCGI